MVTGPVTNRRFSRRAVRQAITIAAGVIIAIVLVTVGWHFISSAKQSRATAAQQQLTDNAVRQAGNLANSFDNIARQLKSLAADELLIGIFAQADMVSLAEQAEQRFTQFKSALKLRFLLPGRYELDSNASPPLSFASLDLLKRAERSAGIIGADVHMPGTPDEHIVMLQRVNNQAGELIGLIHLSLNVSLFEQMLANLSLTDTYVELQQSVAGKRLLLGKRGDAKLRIGEPLFTAVNGTRWTLAYWQGRPGVVQSSDSSFAVLAMIILLIVVVAGGAGFVILRRPQAKNDVASGNIVYAGAVKAIMEGAHPGMEKLVPNLPNLGQQASIQPVSEGMIGDDVTMIMNIEELKAGAAEDVFDITQEAAAEQPAAAKPEAAQPAATTAEAVASQQQAGSGALSPEIFRAYDIRGIVGETLTVETVTQIGQAIGSEAASRGEQGVIVGRDGRISSPELAEALIAGLRASGRDVIDVGMVPTPVLYFATHFLDANSGVMLTGSHNGPEYNGLKIVLGGDTLAEDAIQGLYDRIVENNLETGQGTLQSVDLNAEYIRRISEDIPVALGGAFKIVVDCGNGVAGGLAPQLYRALGHDVVELYCEIDGNFPNHHPDPSQPENLQALIERVKTEQADLGFAFDGDGDRLGVVDSDGKIIWPDRQLMLLAKDVLLRNAGAEIIFDVKCSRYLKAVIEASGGKPLMWKTGHSLIKRKMKETNAPLAGEMSGHIFFKERWYGFDDALYTGARVLEVLMNAKLKPAEVFAELPEGISTPELKVSLVEQAHQPFMQALKAKMAFDGAEIFDIDGVRAEFSDGWGLVRPSNTSPYLVLRFEAETQGALNRIQDEFRNLMLSINPDLQLPF